MALLTGNHTHGYGMDLVITSELLTSEILASQSSFSVLLPLLKGKSPKEPLLKPFLPSLSEIQMQTILAIETVI